MFRDDSITVKCMVQNFLYTEPNPKRPGTPAKAAVSPSNKPPHIYGTSVWTVILDSRRQEAKHI